MPQNEPRRHHIQPRVLLKHFAGSDGRVLVVPRDRAKSPRLDKIDNVSVINHANSIETDAGRDTELEKMLAQIEGHFPAIIERLDNDGRTDDDDRHIVALVAVQFARDPFNRAWVGETADLIYEALRFAISEAYPDASSEYLQSELDHYGRNHIVMSHLEPHSENVAKAGTPYLIRKVFEELSTLKVTVLHAPSGGFFTADSPVSLFDRYALAGRSDEEALWCGFQPETEIVLPVTSSRAVLLTTTCNERDIRANRSVIAIVNARTARAAARNVYCHPDYPPQMLKIDMSTWWWSRPITSTL